MILSREIRSNVSSNENLSSLRSLPIEANGKWFGVYPALVTNVNDPEYQGRVQISLPWIAEQQNYSGDIKGAGCWARLATLMAGENRGTWFIPDVEDEVLVAFEGGDPAHPYVIGSLWNGRDNPPATMDGSGQNHRKIIQTRNGIVFTLDDMDGQERITLETPAGQKVTMDDGSDSVKIEDSNGNSITLEAHGIVLNASQGVVVNAAKVQVHSSLVEVDASLAKFSGMIKCSSLVADSVVSASYTPGSGNIW